MAHINKSMKQHIRPPIPLWPNAAAASSHLQCCCSFLGLLPMRRKICLFGTEQKNYILNNPNRYIPNNGGFDDDGSLVSLCFLFLGLFSYPSIASPLPHSGTLPPAHSPILHLSPCSCWWRKLCAPIRIFKLYFLYSRRSKERRFGCSAAMLLLVKAFPGGSAWIRCKLESSLVANPLRRQTLAH